MTALARGLDILACFSAESLELGTKEIANRTGLPQTTVWRLCHTLTDCGYLRPAGSKLRLGLKSLSLGYAALTSQRFYQVAVKQMQRLADDHGGAVSLAIPLVPEAELLIVQRAQSTSALVMTMYAGSHVPMLTSGLGWAHLCSLPLAVRETTLSALLESDESIPNKALLREAMDAAYRRFKEVGYVVNRGWYHPDVVSVAVPIAGAESDKMALNFGIPAVAIEDTVLEAEVAPRLVSIAHLIEAGLR